MKNLILLTLVALAMIVSFVIKNSEIESAILWSYIVIDTCFDLYEIKKNKNK